MKKTWHYLLNTFLNVTFGTFRLANRISLYHLGALKNKIAIPFILGLYNSYAVVHANYSAAYKLWRVQYALQQSKTLVVTNLLKTLSGTKARKWDNAVQDVYDKGSPEYMALLPNGRKDFQTGTQTDRLEAVNALSGAIGANPLLATLKIDVDAFSILLDNALTEQKGAISGTETASDACEKERVLMCEEQYANLGALMQFYKQTPLDVESFFDLRVLRNGLQILFMGMVKKKAVKMIVQRTIEGTDQLLLENNGVTELRFYLSDSKNGTIGLTFVSVTAGAQKTVSASDLGSVDAQHFLMVYNPDAINKGEFTVEMI